MIKLQKLIKLGTWYKPTKEPWVNEDLIDEAIELLVECAHVRPGVLLTELYQHSHSHMACLGLAVLSAAGPAEFISDGNVKHAAVDILLSKNPIQLLEFVEYLKSRTFGRGFGSRPQKWVRRVMETWQPDDLNKYLNVCPEEMYDLIRLIHPRYSAERGDMVSEFLNKVS